GRARALGEGGRDERGDRPQARGTARGPAPRDDRARRGGGLWSVVHSGRGQPRGGPEALFGRDGEEPAGGRAGARGGAWDAGGVDDLRAFDSGRGGGREGGVG